jgi:hypothetical protein
MSTAAAATTMRATSVGTVPIPLFNLLEELKVDPIDEEYAAAI